MGIKNYLVEGVSGTGKTSVCDELLARGYQAIHGDRELAYQGDPESGVPVENGGHLSHIWDVSKVESIISDKSEPVTFFCGGSRNFKHFIHLFDEVFILEVEWSILESRLLSRSDDEFGSTHNERKFIRRLHSSGEDLPKAGVKVDSSKPTSHVVDIILTRIR